MRDTKRGEGNHGGTETVEPGVVVAMIHVCHCGRSFLSHVYQLEIQYSTGHRYSSCADQMVLAVPIDLNETGRATFSALNLPEEAECNGV